MFLSDRKQRLSVRSVEILVKKYAQTVTTLKKITPHKLRSTYGTALYRQTNDIYLVADVLGHKDVNTTKKHYAAMDEETIKSDYLWIYFWIHSYDSNSNIFAAFFFSK